MPGKSSSGRAALHQIAGEEWVYVVNRIDLRMRRIFPAAPQGGKPAFHRMEHILHFLPQAFAAGVVASHDMIPVVRMTFGCFAATGDDEGGGGRRGRPRIAKGMKDRFLGRFICGTHVRARHRIEPIDHDPQSANLPT